MLPSSGQHCDRALMKPSLTCCSQRHAAGRAATAGSRRGGGGRAARGHRITRHAAARRRRHSHAAGGGAVEHTVGVAALLPPIGMVRDGSCSSMLRCWCTCTVPLAVCPFTCISFTCRPMLERILHFEELSTSAGTAACVGVGAPLPRWRSAWPLNEAEQASAGMAACFWCWAEPGMLRVSMAAGQRGEGKGTPSVQQAFVEAVLEHRKRSLRHASHDDREPIPLGALRACAVPAAPDEVGCLSSCLLERRCVQECIWTCLHDAITPFRPRPTDPGFASLPSAACRCGGSAALPAARPRRAAHARPLLCQA